MNLSTMHVYYSLMVGSMNKHRKTSLANGKVQKGSTTITPSSSVSNVTNLFALLLGVRLGSEAAFEGGRPILGHAPLHANVSQALDLFNRNLVGPFRCTSVCAYLFIAIGFTLSRDPAAELGEAWHVTALRYSGITVFVLSRTGDTLL